MKDAPGPDCNEDEIGVWILKQHLPRDVQLEVLERFNIWPDYQEELRRGGSWGQISGRALRDVCSKIGGEAPECFEFAGLADIIKRLMGEEG